MKLSQAQTIVESAINFNMDLSDGRDAQYIVPYPVGGAGLGKTTMMKQATANVSEQRGVPMECRIISLAQYDPTEIAGWTIPSEDRSHMVRMRPDWMPTDGYGVIFLDELPQAIVACQNIAAQITNERRVGPHHLPDGWVVVAAGNRMSDRAGTNQMPSHLKDRMMFLEIEADLDDTLAYFNSMGVDFRVNSFLRFRPPAIRPYGDLLPPSHSQPPPKFPACTARMRSTPSRSRPSAPRSRTARTCARSTPARSRSPPRWRT